MNLLLSTSKTIQRFHSPRWSWSRVFTEKIWKNCFPLRLLLTLRENFSKINLQKRSALSSGCCSSLKVFRNLLMQHLQALVQVHRTSVRHFGSTISKKTNKNLFSMWSFAYNPQQQQTFILYFCLLGTKFVIRKSEFEKIWMRQKQVTYSHHSSATATYGIFACVTRTNICVTLVAAYLLLRAKMQLAVRTQKFLTHHLILLVLLFFSSYENSYLTGEVGEVSKRASGNPACAHSCTCVSHMNIYITLICVFVCAST